MYFTSMDCLNLGFFFVLFYVHPNDVQGNSLAIPFLDIDTNSEALPSPNSFQNNEALIFDELTTGIKNEEGQRCIDKVVMEERTEYEDTVLCDHTYSRRCHTSYVTNYVAQQEEECKETFQKTCFIQMKPVAFNETVQVCHNPLVKDCNIQGPEVCRTKFETKCWSRQEEHDIEDDIATCQTITEEKCEDEITGYSINTKCTEWPKQICKISKKNVRKVSPITGCTKEPVEICAPYGCGFKEGPEKCFEEMRTIIQESPEEQCSLDPGSSCKHVTKIVPQLTQHEECVDVPKELCSKTRRNPRKLKIPVIMRWCYTPSGSTRICSCPSRRLGDCHLFSPNEIEGNVCPNCPVCRKCSDAPLSSIVFVVDTTKSVGENENSIKNLTTKTLTRLTQAKKLDRYLLVEFNDVEQPIREERIVADTGDVDTFQEAVSSLIFGDGGDHLERLTNGLELALRNSSPNSLIIVFTDSGSKNLYLVDRIKELKENQNSTVFIVLTPTYQEKQCSPRVSDYDRCVVENKEYHNDACPVDASERVRQDYRFCQLEAYNKMADKVIDIGQIGAETFLKEVESYQTKKEECTEITKQQILDQL